MTLCVYLHSKSKRAETLALLDSGATENFMSLDYAKHLHLPIKTLSEPRRLFNVDGTPNKAGDLKYYTDLGTRMGTSTRTLRYFLSDLGDSRVILGYPWFVAAQPKIDWARGWIAHDQLPIVLRSIDAAKAQFLPRQATARRGIELSQFLKEHTARGTIQPSKSPYATSFFFIKKKNGKL